MGISAIVMSPPCQPFTRQGLQKDIGDARTEPLLNVIKMIPDLERLDYALVENVKGVLTLYNAPDNEKIIVFRMNSKFTYIFIILLT